MTVHLHNGLELLCIFEHLNRLLTDVDITNFGSLQNGNYLGLLELVSQFDTFLASHIAKYGNSGKGNPSHLSKTICEELIEITVEPG